MAILCIVDIAGPAFVECRRMTRHRIECLRFPLSLNEAGLSFNMDVQTGATWSLFQSGQVGMWVRVSSATSQLYMRSAGCFVRDGVPQLQEPAMRLARLPPRALIERGLRNGRCEDALIPIRHRREIDLITTLALTRGEHILRFFPAVRTARTSIRIATQ